MYAPAVRPGPRSSRIMPPSGPAVVNNVDQPPGKDYSRSELGGLLSYLVAFVTVLVSGENKRFGVMAARTLVVCK